MRRSNHNQEPRNEGLPRFSNSGAVLTPEEREEVAIRQGLCPLCARKTHKVKAFGSNKPLNNENVLNGICLICNRDKRPFSVAMVTSQPKCPNDSKPLSSDSVRSTGESPLASTTRNPQQSETLKPDKDQEFMTLARSHTEIDGSSRECCATSLQAGDGSAASAIKPGAFPQTTTPAGRFRAKIICASRESCATSLRADDGSLASSTKLGAIGQNSRTSSTFSSSTETSPGERDVASCCVTTGNWKQKVLDSDTHRRRSRADSDGESANQSSGATASTVGTDSSRSINGTQTPCRIDHVGACDSNNTLEPVDQPCHQKRHSGNKKSSLYSKRVMNEKKCIGALCSNPGLVASDEKSIICDENLSKDAWAALQAMRKNPNSAASQIKAFQSLSMLIESSKAKDQSLSDGTIQTITQAMARHPDNAELNKMALATLKKVIGAKGSPVQSVPFDELVTSILQVTYNLSDSVSVQKEVCGVLSTLSGACFNGNSTSLGTMFNILLDLMTIYKGDQCPFYADFHCQALIAMEAMTALAKTIPVPLCCKDIRLILTIMYKSMEHHPTRTDILQTVLAVLLNIAEIHQQEIVDCGGVLAVTDSMNEYPGVEEIQEKGCEVLSVLAKDVMKAQYCLQETGGIDTIVSAMFSFSSNLTVQMEGCRVLANLCGDSKSRMLIESQGGSMLIVTAIKEHSGDSELQKTAVFALQRLHPDKYTEILSDSNLGSAIYCFMQKEI